MCQNDECEAYPIYGVAPHECYWRKEGGFEKNALGTSTIEPLSEWPENFFAEIDKSKPVKEQLSWGLCGVYFCPDCMTGKEQFPELLSINEIKAAIAA